MQHKQEKTVRRRWAVWKTSVDIKPTAGLRSCFCVLPGFSLMFTCVRQGEAEKEEMKVRCDSLSQCRSEQYLRMTPRQSCCTLLQYFRPFGINAALQNWVLTVCCIVFCVHMCGIFVCMCILCSVFFFFSHLLSVPMLMWSTLYPVLKRCYLSKVSLTSLYTYCEGQFLNHQYHKQPINACKGQGQIIPVSKGGSYESEALATINLKI